MGLFGGPCKRLVKYDGTSFDLSGLAGPEAFKFAVGQIGVKPEILQVAGEIVQLYDAVQYSNCTRIQMIPQDSPERIKMIYKAMELEREIVTFALLTKLLAAQPTNENLQKGLIDWIAHQTTRYEEVSSYVQKATLKLGLPRRELDKQIPTGDSIRTKLESAKTAEPRLGDAIRSRPHFDMDRLLNAI